MAPLSLSIDLENELDLNPRRRRQRKFEQYTPEVEESVLQAIGGKALSGVSAVGNLLDVPGSMVRDAIGGENPFDQLLSPFSDQNRLTGRDLLRRGGFVGQDDTYGNWWGGLAAEIALDPTTYLTFGAGALTKAGKVAQAAGMLDDVAKVAGKGVGRRAGRMTTTLGSLLDNATPDVVQAAERAAVKSGTTLDALRGETLGTLARAELPFTGAGLNLGGGSSRVSRGLATGMDAIEEAAKGTYPVRAFRAVFDPSVGGNVERAAQQVSEHAYRIRKVAERAARGAHQEALQGMRETFDAFNETYGEKINNFGAAESLGEQMGVWNVYEKVISLAADTNGDVDTAFKQILGKSTPAPTPEMAERIRSIGNDLQASMRTIRDSIEAKGGRVGLVEAREAEEGLAGFGYTPRYVTPKAGKEFDPLKSPRLLGTTFDSMKKREDAIRTIPKEIVNKMAIDPEVRGRNAAAHIWGTYGEFLSKDDALKHADDLADYFSNKQPFAPFQMRTSDEYLKYMKGSHLVDANISAIHELVRKHVVDGDRSGTVMLEQAFKSAGLDADKALDHLAGLTKQSVDDLKKAAIPEDMARAIVGVNRVHTQPEWAKAIGDSIDKFNNWFKSNVTVPFPSFWTRNFTSGQYMNMVSGLLETPADVAEYGKQVWRVKDMLTSKIPDDLLSELITEGVIDPRMLSEGVESASGHLVSGAPGKPWALGQTLSESRQTVLDNPLFTDKLPGTRTARTAWEAVKTTGSKASANVEFANRVPMYLYLREKGWSGPAAAAKVGELQIDYSDLASAERAIFKRLAPFWSFQRKIAPVVFTTLLERPGGAMGQTIRASNRGASDDVTLPEQITGTLAIPNPFAKEGESSESFITGFGLPYEAPLAFFGGGVRGALRESLSQTTPILKGPLEWAAGESFFQRGPGGGGRDLDELDPLLGRAISNIGETAGVLPSGSDALRLPLPFEFALANSPVSRSLATVRQAADPRKTIPDKLLNAFTGVRVTDVSPTTKDKVLRERATELMEELGAKSFERVFFTESEKARMDPETLAKVEGLEVLQAVLAQRAKNRKKESK